MCNELKQSIEKSEQANIVAETAKINWQELEIFYAKGMVIYVSPELDLIKVAHVLSIDDSDTLKSWMEKKKILRQFDEYVKSWSKDNRLVWSVVVKPWVLVQEIKS